jgi:hypothetical protein
MSHHRVACHSRLSAHVPVLAGILLLVGGPPAWAQRSAGIYLKQAVVRVTDNTKVAGRLTGYGYNDGISILGTWLPAGGRSNFRLQLTAGVSYMFIAGGDNDAQDVDLEVFDDAGNQLAADTRVAPDALVVYTPAYSGWYRLRVALYRSRDNLPCACVLTILKRNGWDVPLGNLDNATDKLTNVLAEADQLLQRQGRRLDLHKESNQWTVYGAVLAEKRDTDVINLSLGRGLRAFFAVGDQQAFDVDLFLLDNSNRIIAKDDRSNPEAYLIYQRGPGLHGLRMRNFVSRGRPALVMTAIFDVRE